MFSDLELGAAPFDVLGSFLICTVEIKVFCLKSCAEVEQDKVFNCMLTFKIMDSLARICSNL